MALWTQTFCFTPAAELLMATITLAAIVQQTQQQQPQRTSGLQGSAGPLQH